MTHVDPELAEVGDSLEQVTVAAELAADEAERDIVEAVRGRRGVAREYVRRMRRRHPDASPADIFAMLERHYVTAISAAGTAVMVGGIAAELGISFIPGGGAAKAGAKAVAVSAAKTAAKKAALELAKTGARQATRMIPNADERLQFELTAIFALSLGEMRSRWAAAPRTRATTCTTSGMWAPMTG
ncbi:hypothetical protein [Propioniciclava soli]|uniref:hypothetical protein n=1 Tax=Propioniciclava soli TaxID=2775081 RepID=UPI001E41E7DA|nr:hypothetical protein [Propioniciclava soli]